MGKRESVVLFVDDEENVLRALKRDFRREPYTVVTAASGQAGLARLEEGDVAVVVSDSRMPEMPGVAFLAEVRERWPDTFRMMLTAFGDVDTVTSAVNEGEVHRFLSKPWDSNELKLAVREGLERHLLIRENRKLLAQLEARNRELQDLNRNLEHRVDERTRALEEAHAELAQAEKLSAVGRVASGVVHEVLNPLTVVRGRIDLMLMDEALNVKHRKTLETVTQQVDQAVEIMEHMRRVARKRPLKRTRVDLNVLARHTLDLVKYEMRRRSIQATFEPGEPADLEADSGQLSQVFLNLANNAVDAMEEGGELTVRIVPEAAGEAVSVLFTDTGPGIAGEDLDRIFESFYTTKENGTGLGLPICREIVESHGGQLEVESRPGEGTTFTVRLPLKGPRKGKD